MIISLDIDLDLRHCLLIISNTILQHCCHDFFLENTNNALSIKLFIAYKKS